MNSRHLVFLCGLAGGFVLKAMLDVRAQSAASRATERDTGAADADRMEASPQDWDIVDEQGDGSFPASDPPGNY